MKGLVLEVRGKTVLVMDETGVIRRVRVRHPVAVGQRLALAGPGMTRQSVAWIAATAAVLLLVSGFGWWGFLQPVRYISLDVNPAFSLALNRLDLVLSAEG